MKILISGSSGTVGTHLIEFMSSNSFEIWRLVRSKAAGENRIFWDPDNRRIDDPSLLENFDAAIHLSGENIVGRWTQKKKDLIRKSRLDSTRYLTDLFLKLKNPPKTFICASAIGYYGNRGEEKLTERSSPGSGFLPDLSREWEHEAKRVSEAGIRVVNLRIGIVLSVKGGMLGSMLPPFKMGLGGIIGKGTQYVSWVSIEDVSRIIVYLLKNGTISGPVNIVSPAPVTNREFTEVLSSVLKKPAWFSIPEFAVRLFFGEMGNSTMLSGSRVFPEKLLSGGYEFTHVDLSSALEYLIFE